MKRLATLLLRYISAMTTVLLVATLIGLLYGVWRLSRNRRNPDFWEGGLLWLMSFLVVIVLLVRA